MAEFIFDLRCAVRKCDDPARHLSSIELAGTGGVKLQLLFCDRHVPGMIHVPGPADFGIIKKS